jgi:O-antigen/teichoic acid export membrane protein
MHGPSMTSSPPMRMQVGSPAAPTSPDVVRRIARNSLVPMAAQFLNKGLFWAFNIYMLRVLGPAGSGTYAVATNLVTYCAIVADFGLTTLLARDIAREPQLARRYTATGATLRLLLTLGSWPVLALVALWRMHSGGDGDFGPALGLLALSLLPGALSGALSALYYGHERMSLPAGVQVLTAAVNVVLGAALLFLGWGVLGLAAASLVANLVTLAALYAAARRDFFSLELGFDPGLARYFLAAAFPLMLNSLLNSLFFRIDIQILDASGPVVLPWGMALPGGEEAVGHYTAAYKVVDAMQVLSSSFVLALFPTLAKRAGTADRVGLATAYGHALRFLMLIGLPAALVLSFYAAEIIGLFAGPRFLPHSALALSILAWFIPLSFVNGVTQYILIALDRQRLITVAFALATAFNIAANLALIPRFGYLAAAATTVASECVLVVPFGWAARQELRAALADGLLLRVLPAAAVAGGVLWVAKPWLPALALPLGLGVYALTGLLFGAVARSDLMLVRRALARG